MNTPHLLLLSSVTAITCHLHVTINQSERIHHPTQSNAPIAIQVVKLLVTSGADPRITTSGPPRPQLPLDVAKTDEVKNFLLGWDIKDTESLVVRQRMHRLMNVCTHAKLHACIHAER